ncbi:hypothetical protein AB833_09945 [Chromatiales bacterium (ex Bugula neritina AB1)]|nr:hypothetical protein AB833_09945 [Chromatiales bacterium (ex Bugula neritina AB1)]
MDRNSQRLLLTLEQERRNINRETINPVIQELDIDGLRPIVTMVAEVRAAYIKSLMDLAQKRDGLPSAEEIKSLTLLRKSFNELVDAANAMETAIERGYLDVSS